MEVHAHTHTARKKWTHYFWEFLMLFLAVFCGFLAENFREHQVEKEKGRQYIYSLYADLKYDTGRISGMIDIETIKIAALRKMPDCYDTIKKNWTGTGCLLDLIKYSRSNTNFHMTDRTLKQLANAGGFRLLEKQDADSIVSYENDNNNMQDFEITLFQPAQDNVRNTFNELVEFSANTKLFRNVVEDPGAYNGEVKLPLLFSDDKALLNKYFNQLFLYLRVTVRHRIQLMNLKQHTTMIIEYLKNKYHLQ